MEDRKGFNPDDVLDRAVDAILRGPTPDELPPERVAELTAAVRHAADRPCPITLTNRIKDMKLRTRITVAAAVLIGCVGLVSWLAPGNGTALAFLDTVTAYNQSIAEYVVRTDSGAAADVSERILEPVDSQ